MKNDEDCGLPGSMERESQKMRPKNLFHKLFLSIQKFKSPPLKKEI